MYVTRYFRSIFIRKFINRKKNCESWRRNHKSRLRFFNLKKAFIPPHPLTNFEIKKYYENESRFNGVYSRDHFSKTIKNGAYVINLDECANVRTRWVALYVKNDEVIYFDSFGVEYIPKEIERFI